VENFHPARWHIAHGQIDPKLLIVIGQEMVVRGAAAIKGLGQSGRWSLNPDFPLLEVAGTSGYFTPDKINHV